MIIWYCWRSLIGPQAITLLVLLLIGCGGEGGGGKSNLGWLTITNPVPGGSTHDTTDASTWLHGNAFISPSDANCSDNLPQKLSITWSNAANGSSGVGKSLAGCFIFFIAAIEESSWDVPYGDIPLEIGSNEITVTARDSLGNSGSDLITVRRREIPLPDPTEGLQFNYFEDSAGAANFKNFAHGIYQ